MWEPSVATHLLRCLQLLGEVVLLLAGLHHLVRQLLLGQLCFLREEGGGRRREEGGRRGEGEGGRGEGRKKGEGRRGGEGGGEKGEGREGREETTCTILTQHSPFLQYCFLILQVHWALDLKSSWR